RAQVRALGLRAGTFSAPLWTVDAIGTRVEVLEGRYLRVTHSSCCSTIDTHTLYDVANGRRMMSYTSPLLVVRVERGEPILLSFESGDAAGAPAELGGDGGVGVLRVSRGARMLDRLVLRGATLEAGDLAACDAAGRVRNAEWAEPGTTLHACIAMFDGGVAVFPVRDGRFILEAATLPPGLTAVRFP
ncbi:MAG TPA: hypothetical protein VE913_02850, partial [Longimicrobium sp.]|nr:hypothetical protein [Longimicrobium sp.]